MKADGSSETAANYLKYGHIIPSKLMSVPILVPAPVLSLDTGDEGCQAGHVARGALQATLESCNTSYPRETRERQQCYPPSQRSQI